MLQEIRFETRVEPLPTTNGRSNGFHAKSLDLSSSAAEALAAELRVALDGEVRFDNGSRGAYSTDASNYRQIPIGVVIPRTVADVISTVRLCHQYGVPVTSRGGGTSLAGQCCNVAVILDFSKYLNRVLSIDPERKLAVVEPGCVLDTLRTATEPHALTFGPDPATHSHNTLGGMIGNNSCGIHSVMAQFYGPGPRTEDNIESLDILTYDGVRMTVGPTSEEDLAQIIAAGGRRGEIYTHLRDLRDRYADEIRGRYPHILRRVSGYNLPHLLPENGFNVAKALVGSEGTCVTILQATVKLTQRHPARALLVLGYPDVYTAGDHTPQIMAHKPIGLEGIDDELVDYMKKKGLHPNDVELLPDGAGWLLVEFGDDTKEAAEHQAQQLMDELQAQDNPPSMKLFKDRWEEQKLWEVRESGLGATAHVPGLSTTHPGWEDAGVPHDKVGAYLRDFRQLLNDFGYHAALYGHFGQGCIHCRIDFDLETAKGVRKYLAFIDQAADLVVSYGGSLSGEHGDGQARAALLPKMYGEDLVNAFRKFKSIWDPAWKMNPGKVVDPYQPDENLRMGPNYNPKQVQTYFQFPNDDGSFAKAAARCVGVGKCRRMGDGTMCPSYMVTREEEDSTRGRARLLFEMLQGDVIADGWRDDHVREALDLCLACKGCKNDCPVNVDMATYKAEFLAHYYAGRLRPMAAYSMGLIYWWARLASRLPQVANFFTQREPFATLVKRLGGIAPQRRMPTFATQTFTDWFRHHEPHAAEREHRAQWNPQAVAANQLHHGDVPRYQSDTYDEKPDTQVLNQQQHEQPFAQKRVLLWPDTFNNYLMPPAAKAAVEVLEAAGYEVEIPPRPLCCGRPLYDWGMLDMAKGLWRQTLTTLRPWIRAGIPVVGLEPSCVATFRDELVNLFPNDEDAKRLSQQTYLFSEFLEHENYEPPQLQRKALVHGHCHHKAIMHMDAEMALLKKMGLDYDLPDSGCCGMAGSFGFEASKYDVSIGAGERVLLPIVRQAEKETLIIADGFSCREQIQQTTDRQALHVAQVLQMALREGDASAAGAYPERHYNRIDTDKPGWRTPVTLLVGAGALLAVLSLLRRYQKRSPRHGRR
ncbi:MAG: FAD-linked oxidase C-terminal domain-containing protein [Caldilineaceae bacterium]